MGKKTAKLKSRGQQPRSGRQGDRPNTHELLKKAIQCQTQGKFDQAGNIYREILAINPDDPDALHLLGLVAIEEHNLDEAKRLIQQAIVNFPAMPSFHVALGRVHAELGEFEEAQACYETAMQRQPDYADAHFHMGNLHRFRQQNALSIACYQQVLRLSPDNSPALNNLGNSLKELGRYDEALTSYRQAVEIDPTLAEAYNNMGNTYKDMNKPQEAVACYQKALAVRPQYADPYNNIGYILQRQGKLSEALVFLGKALEINPRESGILHNIGNVYKDMGEFEQAIAVYRQALVIKPGFIAVHSNILFALNYADNIAPAVMYGEAWQWWQQQAANVANQFSFEGRLPIGGRRLKIGYVSPDFCQHSVSFFLLSLLQTHDKDRFEIYCYADVRRPDEMTVTLQGHADHWRSILGLSDETVARQIFDDRIDILVDLAGHTSDNRLLVFARKPAPVQISWLGYPNTTGLATMDYRLTDHIADPEGLADQFYSEKLFRLPQTFLCYTPWTSTPEVSEPPVARTGQVTFGSFNNITKLTRRAIGVWAEILKKVPGSRLLLKDTILADPQGRERFLALFANQGIGPGRIVLMERTESPTDHLALYREMDIGLDPFPYNGTTTTCEALWMGVPVISLRGEVHAARVGATLLSHIGHPELIAETTEDYIQLAVALASDPARLTAFRRDARSQLRDSSLCNADQFARDMEEAYSQMWQAWETGATYMNAPQNTAATTVQHNAHHTPVLSSQASESLLTRIKNFPFWYHKIALPGGITTPGWAPINPEAYGIPADLTGKRVLDIGAWDGYWTFEALKRGARQVIAIDDFSDYLGTISKRDRKAWETFDLCKESLGYTDDRCKRVEMTIYDLTEQTFGHFDVVFFFGTLYHLRYPLLALDKLAAVCDGEIFVESAILDDFSPYRGGFGAGYANQMVMEFYPNKEYGNNDSNWWALSLLCLVNMLAAAGFTDCRGWKLTDSPTELSHCRGFASGKKAGQEGQPSAATSESGHPAPVSQTACNKSAVKGTRADISANQANHLNQLGNQSCQQGRLAEAEAYFTQALAFCPDSPLLLVNLGVVKNDLGRPTEALEDLKRAIRLQPDFAEAHFNLANALLKLDLAAEAVAFYQQAIHCKPGYVDAYKNLGGVLISLGQPQEAIRVLAEGEKQAANNVGILHLLSQAALAMGKPDEALGYCQKAVETNPQCAEVYENLGMLYFHSAGRLPEAAKALEQTVALRPDNCSAHNNLGLVYNDLQEYGKAIAQYQQGLALEPHNAILFFNLGITLGNLGRTENAMTAYRQAINLRPGYTDAMLNLAHACRGLGDDVEAEALYRQVMDLAPAETVALHNLGILKLAHNQPLEAWRYCRQAVRLEPNDRVYWQQLAQCLAQVAPLPDTQDFEDDLLHCLATEGIYRDPLARPAIALLQGKPAFIAAQAAIGDSAQLTAMLAAGQLDILRSPLLLLILEHAVINSLALEKMLTTLRRHLLLHPLPATATEATHDATLAFSVALAHQCSVNEYLYPETDEETLQVQQLKATIEQAMAEDQPIAAAPVAIIGCYLPLGQVRDAKLLLDRSELKGHGLPRLLVRQVREPLTELELRKEITALFAIDNDISQRVRDQYEENPYPRWTDVPVLAPPGSLSMSIRKTFPFLRPEEMLVSATPEILVAGCGTGRQAIQTSHTYSGSAILAVDLSRASLAYAQRKARQYGVTNISFAQADILTLGELHRQFDLIICSGVLHHMQEPLAGWQVLVSLLKPGGFMKIGLYSEVARQPIVAAREIIKQQGYPASPAGIRSCRQTIMASVTDPQMVKLTQLHDFYTMSDCRDLLFHVQEHRFTMPQLRQAIAQLGLTFLGFTFDNPTVLANYHACYPDDSRGDSWQNWHDYESAHPDLFLGMYNFWVQLPASASASR